MKSLSKHPILANVTATKPPLVVTNEETAKTFYDGLPKLLISSDDFQIASKLFDGKSPFIIYLFRKIGENIYINRHGSASTDGKIPLSLPPPLCLGMIALSETGNSNLMLLRRLWSDDVNGFLPPLLALDTVRDPGQTTSLIYRELLTESMTLCAAVAARLVNLQRQFSTLRTVHAQLQNAFDAVETFLSRSHLPPTALAFGSDPTDVAVGPVAGEIPFEVSQVMPAPSQGMAAIEVHVRLVDPSAAGELLLSITTQEDIRLLGSWRIPYQKLAAGWQYLNLPEVDVATKQSVLLKAVWQTRSGTPPRLSLSALQPVDESQVLCCGAEQFSRSLALRVHIGLPGTRRFTHPFHVRDSGHSLSGDGLSLKPLDLSILHTYVEIGSSRRRRTRAKLAAERDAIELVASPGRSTIVKLPGGLPPGASRLSATIKSGASDRATGEHALLALADDHNCEKVLENGVIGKFDGGFSGWLPVKPDWLTQIHIQLAEPVQTPLDIYFVTRTAVEVSVGSVVAQWGGLLVGFHEGLG